MKRNLLLLTAVILACNLIAQVTSNPSPIPGDYTGTIILTFDPTQGNGGMKNATACYSHIGLITETSNGEWAYLKNTNWGTTEQPQWTKKSNGKWELTIDNMFTYFGCPTTEKIYSIVMVFHNGKGGTSQLLEGKSDSNGDIYVPVNNTKTGTYNFPNGFEPKAVVEEKRPDGVDVGIYYDPDDATKVTLCTFAAAKMNLTSTEDLIPAQYVYLFGDMNGWEFNNDYQLKRDGNYFWITLTGLQARREYRFQYVVIRSDGIRKQITDLFCEKVLTKDDEGEPRKVNPSLLKYPDKADGSYVGIFQTGKKEYAWSDATLNFQRPDKNNLIIYELWIYDYTPDRCIKSLMERLDYLQNLGVNAIELMPVNEFDGNYNWGYAPNHYFALDKAYGTPNQMKAFVDACHQRGMAVILDMVFNHATGNNPMNRLYPYGTDLAYNPCFNVTPPHKDEDMGQTYYEDWNHDFPLVKNMFRRALQYWLTEYKVDGFRMDLSHGFCGMNCNERYNNLLDYYDAVKEVSPDAYFIQEYWGSWPSQGTLINDGMLCWTGNSLNEAYSQLAMGYTSNSSLNPANRDGYVAYSESHDEERNFYQALTYGAAAVKGDANEEARISRVPAIMAFNNLLNGSHMIYMYGELGFDFSINSGDGRTSTKKRIEPLGWLEWGSLRMQQYEKVAQAIQLRTRLLPDVFKGNPTAASLESSFIRSVQWGNDVYVVANFSPNNSDAVDLPSGTWYDYYKEKKMNSSTFVLKPGEVKIFTGKLLPLPVVDGSNTGIKDILTPNVQSHTYKIMHHGQLMIVRDGIFYDCTGRRIED